MVRSRIIYPCGLRRIAMKVDLKTSAIPQAHYNTSSLGLRRKHKVAVSFVAKYAQV
jgi:hypothetical protein